MERGSRDRGRMRFGQGDPEEEKTQFGIIINLPHDHTAASTNAAIIAAFAKLPNSLKRSLIWDQRVEMARHQVFTKETGGPVHFAERTSPRQRGSNRHFNGLLRQYSPSGRILMSRYFTVLPSGQISCFESHQRI